MPTVTVEGYDADVEARPGEAILSALCRRATPTGSAADGAAAACARFI